MNKQYYWMRCFFLFLTISPVLKAMDINTSKLSEEQLWAFVSHTVCLDAFQYKKFNQTFSYGNSPGIPCPVANYLVPKQAQKDVDIQSEPSSSLPQQPRYSMHERFQCPLCSRCFLNQMGLNVHKGKMHQSQISNCQFNTILMEKNGEEQDKMVEDEGSMKELKAPPVQCAICSRLCASPFGLKIHLRGIHRMPWRNWTGKRGRKRLDTRYKK